MQYPIIDLITDAYLNNGWTGLDISTGKNLFDYSSIIWTAGYRDDNGNIVTSGSHFTSSIAINPDTTYTLSGTLTTNGSVFRIYFLDSEQGWIGRSVALSTIPYTFTSPINCYYIQIQCIASLLLEDVQLEEGSEATPYEPYSEPKNDFPNRLKLPLPHYFPHPVIDALQRAAAGIQTADDTEILRHYLTPLGIGGI